jgi:putative hydrolase of the HAD superfamily
MASKSPIKAFFLDVGGVLLTNGWDRRMRAEAAERFSLDYTEMNERHHLTFDTYEEGKLSLEEYLDRVIFYETRTFSREEFKDFMFAQSRPLPEMINLVRTLKARYGLKIVVISNEGRELTVHRIQKFNLAELVDFFVSSCFVHLRKPDADIFRMALDMAQVPIDQVVYVDDRAMFVEVAQGLGFRGIVHQNAETTRETLAMFGLSMT